MSDYLDEDGYPTSEALNKITTWDSKDPYGLIEFVMRIWKYESYAESTRKSHWWELHTSGWSGNEDIVSAMMDNTMFWLLYWYSSVRGGHYIFDLSRAPKKKEEE